MGQADVLKVLKEDKWMKSGYLAKKLNQTSATVSNLLRKLFKEGVVLRRDYHDKFNWHRGYEWQLK